MRTLAIAAVLALMLPFAAQADTDVTVDPGKIVNGYMNVFDLGWCTSLASRGASPTFAPSTPAPI